MFVRLAIIFGLLALNCMSQPNKFNGVGNVAISGSGNVANGRYNKFDGNRN
jgi:hypothetical protein